MYRVSHFKSCIKIFFQRSIFRKMFHIKIVWENCFNEKILYYSVLKSSRDKLQEYVKNWGFYLKNSK